jgi:copper chaperone CopZ
VRGALSKLPGVASIDIRLKDVHFSVRYDDRQVQPAALLKALKDAGHEALLEQ